MCGIKIVGLVILVGTLRDIGDLKKHAEKKDLSAMLVDIGYILVFGFIGMTMILS